MIPFNFDDLPETMDIYSEPGTKVIFKYPNNGRDYDKSQALENLTMYATYTVENIQVGQSSSHVQLKECPHMRFNSVHFANINTEES